MTYREANHVLRRGVRPAHDGTQINATATVEGATVVVYTVPADNIFYLCTAVVGPFTIAAGLCSMYILTDGAAVWFPLGYINVGAALDANSVSVTFWPPLEVPADYVVTLLTSAAGLICRGGVFGWIE